MAHLSGFRKLIQPLYFVDFINGVTGMIHENQNVDVIWVCLLGSIAYAYPFGVRSYNNQKNLPTDQVPVIEIIYLQRKRWL